MAIYNVSSGDDGTFLGVSRSGLSGLPSNLRGEVIAALTDADDASRTGDPARVATGNERVEKAAGMVGAHNAERTAERLFLESRRPVRGDHNVIRRIARRAGSGE